MAQTFYTEFDVFGERYEYMDFDKKDIAYIFDLFFHWLIGERKFAFIDNVQALVNFINAKFFYFEFFCRKEVDFLVNGDRRERVSIRLDVLKKVIDYLNSGEKEKINLALTALIMLTNAEMREDMRKRKRDLYFAFKNEADPVKKTFAYEEYQQFMRDCLF